MLARVDISDILCSSPFYITPTQLPHLPVTPELQSVVEDPRNNSSLSNIPSDAPTPTGPQTPSPGDLQPPNLRAGVGMSWPSVPHFLIYTLKVKKKIEKSIILTHWHYVYKFGINQAWNTHQLLAAFLLAVSRSCRYKAT